MLFGQRLAHRYQIVSRIKPLGDRANILAERLAVPQIGGARQDIDLRAGIIDIIFAGYIKASKAQQACKRIAKHRATTMADMHRAGWVSRHKLDIYSIFAAHSATTKIAALFENRTQYAMQNSGVEF